MQLKKEVSGIQSVESVSLIYREDNAGETEPDRPGNVLEQLEKELEMQMLRETYDENSEQFFVIEPSNSFVSDTKSTASLSTLLVE